MIKQHLAICAKTLEHLPLAHQQALAESLALFEHASVPAVWPVSSVPKYLGLSDDERKQALAHFVNDYELTDPDWFALEEACCRVRNERPSQPLPTPKG